MKAYKGYTLIELVIVIIVMAVLSMTFATFIIKAVDSWIFVKTRDSAFGSARYSMNRMLVDMRRMTSPYGITVMTSTECSFEAFDSTGGVVYIDFKQSGANLYRNNDILAENLLNPGGLSFLYLNENGVSTSEAVGVRSVRVKVSIEKNNQLITLESAARLRNL
ncbi:hypothetical protein A3J90_02795 [candidate division WOR-1 bacterium RIFOXYC2_FULL_37_10]|uniref:Prepilin-type N-terminal cleavage/methylation domain-containing protein n=1 Tax=candidate division WOR-1 bacterium RIFOXYB2_FULL_37_13 TaxID=1802579 RepID=A0A1F4SPB0_UNCSA|nr:MAG: hypothetical protein A2246_00270 [candidate division WOR-1 bacterium RIFOXYA2_FULL_37_7]OGC22249.1 MAG: hypothetical protein A2310_01475 [candidate division WOR-1 bacterium RIFOXYB2_FULL_37_13]OGC34541.1 MAG: hypothetical protein A3J90_02795 [candidate division WOR-1 bacterium RIFOXYC2_FULL_37_10]